MYVRGFEGHCARNALRLIYNEIKIINYASDIQTACRANELIAQGIALGFVWWGENTPRKGKSLINMFVLLPLQGELHGRLPLPRVLPWADSGWPCRPSLHKHLTLCSITPTYTSCYEWIFTCESSVKIILNTNFKYHFEGVARPNRSFWRRDKFRICWLNLSEGYKGILYFSHLVLRFSNA